MGHALARIAEVGRGREPGLPAERRHERARGVVAGPPGDHGHRVTGGERGQRRLEPEQRPPAAERYPGAGEEPSVSCRSPAGIHSARVGGSTQAAELVRTMSTPLAAQASWCSGWVCQSNTDPAGMGNVATITAPSGGAVHRSS